VMQRMLIIVFEGIASGQHHVQDDSARPHVHRQAYSREDENV
jgi:hypothetical protein